MTERPETITIAGVELRWSEERKGWESAEPGARPRAVAWYNRWEDFWRATVRVASVRFEIEAETLPSLDAAVRAELAAVRDACAALVGPGVDVEAIRAEERERAWPERDALEALEKSAALLHKHLDQLDMGACSGGQIIAAINGIAYAHERLVTIRALTPAVRT